MHKNNAVNLGTKETEMAQRTHKIIVVLFAFSWPVILQAQKIFQQPKSLQQIVGRKEYEFKQWAHKSSPGYVKNTVLKAGILYQLLPSKKICSFIGPVEIPERYSFHLAPKFYIQSLGVFCQNELQLEKMTRVAFRFRLGSLDYVNWMEQKPNAITPR